MELESLLNQIHVEDSANQLVSVMKSGQNLLVTTESLGFDLASFIGSVLGTDVFMSLLIAALIALAIHWLLLPFTWLPVLAVVLYNCSDNYIENVIFYPHYLMLGYCYGHTVADN